MNGAIEKSISFLLLIIAGCLLRKKISSSEQKNGIKVILLSIALPSMIFVGLQKVSFSWDLLALPLMVLVFNIAAFFFTCLIIYLIRVPAESSSAKTIKMLFPSLAPGLSCFPFLLEYFGEESLANGAIADMGNKFFVLIALYLIALQWYCRSIKNETQVNTKKLGSLFKSLIGEPVNLVILVAVVQMIIGIDYESFPVPLSLTIDRISLIMTPLVFIFIGISVKFNRLQFATIAYLLICRSGFGFLFSGIVLLTFKITDPLIGTLAVLLPQSCCSFWPYAHMNAINTLAKIEGNAKELFDEDLAMNILALSLPYSTVTILCLSTWGERIAEPKFSLIVSAICFAVVLIPMCLRLPQNILTRNQM